jgi:hypothetical protein
MNLTKIKHTIIRIILFSFLLSCSKDNSNQNSSSSESPDENISFTIDPDPGSIVAIALSSTYSFKINVTSKITSKGLKIEVITKKESDNSIIESKQLTSTVPNIDVTIETLSPGVLSNVTIIITSGKTASNSLSKSFKVARK